MKPVLSTPDMSTKPERKGRRDLARDRVRNGMQMMVVIIQIGILHINNSNGRIHTIVCHKSVPVL